MGPVSTGARRFGRLPPTSQIARADPSRDSAVSSLRRPMSSSSPAVGRNDPCPCGSGLRYKQCHGALGAPAHPAALHYLGVVLYQRNRLDEALPLLDRAVALAPEEPEFHNNRGLALAAAQRDNDAIAAY